MTQSDWIPINLHAHERTASGDSRTSLATMAEFYRQAGFGGVGYVGHNARPTAHGGPILPFWLGIERTIRKEPTRLHVVEYPGLDFSFLAHPALTWKENTREQAATFLRSHDLDGVERWNRGEQQYEGHIGGVAELANDDAHNPHQIGDSYMVVPRSTVMGRDGIDPERVVACLQSGDFEVRSTSPHPTRYAVGRLKQGCALALHYLSGGD